MLRKAVLNPTIANPTIMSMIQNELSSSAAEEVRPSEHSSKHVV